MVEIGDAVEHSQFGTGVVNKVIDKEHIKVLFEGDDVEKIVSPKYLAGFVSVGEAIISIKPEDLPTEFLAKLTAPEANVDIRIHYPKHVESYVDKLFSREGIELPDDIRPIASGSRGGTEVQRTLAGEMWFQETGKKERTKVSSLATILSVLKAGFKITKYAKFEEIEGATK